MRSRSDPNCPYCHGAGEVIVSKDPDIDQPCVCTYGEMTEEHPEPPAEAKLARIANTLGDIPACQEHPDGDPITCGWKLAVIAVRAILGDKETG